MENNALSKKEKYVLKLLSRYKNPLMKICMVIFLFLTLFVWVRHWNKFTQSWPFFAYNALIWIMFNLSVYFNVKYYPVIYDLIQRLAKSKDIE